MKSLQEFILESTEQKSDEPKAKEFVFKFKDLENGEETVKSLANVYGCTANEDKQEVTISVNKENANKLETAQDILQQFAQGIRNSTKRASDEQYAQKTKSFEDKVNEFTKAIDDFLNVDADPRDDVKKEEKDSKDKDEE